MMQKGVQAVSRGCVKLKKKWSLRLNWAGLKGDRWGASGPEG